MTQLLFVLICLLVRQSRWLSSVLLPKQHTIAHTVVGLWLGSSTILLLLSMQISMWFVDSVLAFVYLLERLTTAHKAIGWSMGIKDPVVVGVHFAGWFVDLSFCQHDQQLRTK